MKGNIEDMSIRGTSNPTNATGINLAVPDFNYVPEIPKAWDVATMVGRCASKSITVHKGGKTTHVPCGEALVEKMFYDAVAGDAASAKQLVRWAIKYVPVYKMPVVKGRFARIQLSDAHVMHWKEIGCLPQDAPNEIMKVKVSLLNKALRNERELRRSKAADVAADNAKFLAGGDGVDEANGEEGRPTLKSYP